MKNDDSIDSAVKSGVNAANEKKSVDSHSFDVTDLDMPPEPWNNMYGKSDKKCHILSRQVRQSIKRVENIILFSLTSI